MKTTSMNDLEVIYNFFGRMTPKERMFLIPIRPIDGKYNYLLLEKNKFSSNFYCSVLYIVPNLIGKGLFGRKKIVEYAYPSFKPYFSTIFIEDETFLKEVLRIKESSIFDETSFIYKEMEKASLEKEKEAQEKEKLNKLRNKLK